MQTIGPCSGDMMGFGHDINMKRLTVLISIAKASRLKLAKLAVGRRAAV